MHGLDHLEDSFGLKSNEEEQPASGRSEAGAHARAVTNCLLVEAPQTVAFGILAARTGEIGLISWF